MSGANNVGEDLAARRRELAAKNEELAAKDEDIEELDRTFDRQNLSDDADRAHVDDESHCEQYLHEYSGAPVGCDPGCDKCGSSRCVMHHEVLKTASSFTSSVTKKTYYMRHKLNCDSRFVIYLVTCKRCGEQYVGKTT